MGAITSNRNKRDPSNFDHNHPKKQPPKSSYSKKWKKLSSLLKKIHVSCRFKRFFRFISGFISKFKRTKNGLFFKYNKTIGTRFNKHVRDGQEVDDGIVENVIDFDDVIEIVEDDDESEVVDDGSVETEEVVSKCRELGETGTSRNRGVDEMEVDVDVSSPFYKRLYESAGRRDPSLRKLRFDIKSLETSLALQQLSRPAKKKEIANDPFKPLTEEEREMVANALSNSNRSKVLVSHENSNITITGEALQCLRPRAWLNDEIINLYLELLKERKIRAPKKFLKCHFFNTFFYQKLTGGRGGYDYMSVRRWTTQKKLGYGLLECDKIFVPIHKEVHWCLAVINKKEEKFQYLDSLGGMDKKVLRVLAKYITDEVKDKTGIIIDVTSWEQEYVTDLPNQENGYDCGMFMMKYADFYSRDIGLCFNQEHMPYFRQRTAKEILTLRAN